MDNENVKHIEIPTGDSKEDIKERNLLIRKFYQEWKSKNIDRCVYNLDLQEYIYVRNISNVETAQKASKKYLSTLAVLQLDTILTMAKKVRVTKAKQNANQSAFNKMIIMEYLLEGIGLVKITVGEQRRSKLKVQYCITAIDTNTKVNTMETKK